MTRTFAAALFLLASTGVVAAGDDGPNKDWLALDRAMIARLAALLPPGDRSAKAWVQAMRPPPPKPGAGMTEDADAGREPEDQDVGGGARRIVLSLGGGYFTAWVRALVLEDRVVEVDVRCPTRGGSDAKEAATALKDAWGRLPVVRTDEGVRYTWFDGARRKAHRAAIEKAYGPRGDVQVPAALRTTFDLLDAALSDLPYGRMCGEDASPPPGREALEALVKARAAALLRALLRSPNPEGRVYAVEGLERLAKEGEALTDVDRAAIAAIKASPILIRGCSGCIVETATAGEVLRRRNEEDEALRGAEKGK
jgi:hypothetical protein